MRSINLDRLKYHYLFLTYFKTPQITLTFV